MNLEEAKRRYVHRFTMEHVPDWARGRGPDGATWFYAPQYRTDKEWYEKTMFPPNHPLGRRSECWSQNPSWPLGERLDHPYVGVSSGF